MTPSPPGMPNEDYEAIEAAVMETARGRWFLMEYARRNRNADTKLLLDAIARLENQLTGGKHAPTTPHQPVATTTVVSSASAELFAVEPPPPSTAVPFPALPEPPDLAWVEEPEIDMDRPVQPDIFHVEDDLILPAEPVKAPAASQSPPPKPGVSDFGKPGLGPATAESSAAAPPAPALAAAAPPAAHAPAPIPAETGKSELKPATADFRAAALSEHRLAERKPAEPTAEAAQPPAQSRMLAGALAQAEAIARASEPAPPPPPSAFSPAPAEPTELDALSFEEKSVYFG